MNKNYIAIGTSIIAIGMLAFLLNGPANVFGNAFQLASSAKTAAATTTVGFLSPGAGTTTITYDSNEINGSNQTNQGNNVTPHNAMVLIQYTASSSLSTLDMRLEYSMDAIDWYQLAGEQATTSKTVNIGERSVYRFATSRTELGALPAGAIGVASTTGRSVNIDVPTRYVRAVFTVPAGVENGAVWATIVPKKQNLAR